MSTGKQSWTEHLEGKPTHWRVSRLKFLAKICNGHDQKEVLDELGSYNIYGSGGIFGKGNAYLHEGPSVLLVRKGTIDKPLLVREPFWSVDTMFYSDIEDEVDERYFYYHALVIPFDLFRDQTTLPSMTQSGLGSVPLCHPPLPTQQKIADFLDRKTAQIEALNAKKRQLITKLKEKRLAVITQAVTRGLNPKAPLKDSGIEWLGEVPAHWEVVPLGFLVEFRGGMTPNTGTESYWDGDIPWVTPKDMKIDEISDSIDHVTKEAIKETGLSLIDPNAMLIVVRGMILAHSFPTAINRAKVTINQDMKALRCEDRLNPEYLRYTLGGYEKTLSKMATESAHGTRKMETGTLKKFSIPLPPRTEQIDIIDALKNELSRLDKLSSKSESTITRLTEYRTALITAAVTGQLEIPQTPASRSSA
ncbi:MAG: hypothetical protein GVY36_16670 [Verrucomicrobia bacterium]|jgi:type I restriction enzyme S subunit|nr:hypothetical protein [Verrucomicrobiota bacterium]